MLKYKTSKSVIYDEDDYYEQDYERPQKIGGYPSEEDEDINERNFYDYNWYFYDN